MSIRRSWARTLLLEGVASTASSSLIRPRSEPDRRRRGLDGASRRGRELGRERVQVELVAETGHEVVDHLLGIVSGAMEAPIDALLDPLRSGLNMAATRSVDAATATPSFLTSGLTCDTSARLTTAKTDEQHDGHDAVADGVADDPVDVVQAVAQDGDRDREQREGAATAIQAPQAIVDVALADSRPSGRAGRG